MRISLEQGKALCLYTVGNWTLEHMTNKDLGKTISMTQRKTIPQLEQSLKWLTDNFFDHIQDSHRCTDLRGPGVACVGSYTEPKPEVGESGRITMVFLVTSEGESVTAMFRSEMSPLTHEAYLGQALERMAADDVRLADMSADDFDNAELDKYFGWEVKVAAMRHRYSTAAHIVAADAIALATHPDDIDTQRVKYLSVKRENPNHYVEEIPGTSELLMQNILVDVSRRVYDGVVQLNYPNTNQVLVVFKTAQNEITFASVVVECIAPIGWVAVLRNFRKPLGSEHVMELRTLLEEASISARSAATVLNENHAADLKFCGFEDEDVKYVVLSGPDRTSTPIDAFAFRALRNTYESIAHSVK